MALSDLDLEFEEEGEKSSGIIDIGEELNFNAAPTPKTGATKPVPKAPAQPIQKTQVKQPERQVSHLDKTNPNLTIPKNLNQASSVEPSFNAQKIQESKIRNLDEHRQRVERKPELQTQTSTKQDFATADEVLFLRNEIENLKKEMADVKLDSEVRARVAEEKAKFMIESVTEAKMMNYQVTQILQRMNAKSPDLKNEVLMVKKLLDDFLKKTGS